jgi:hypothetical protein
VTGSGPGRIDSGEMRDAITSKSYRSGDLVSVAMGWFNPGSDQEYPINYQEVGLTHENGDFIEGMNSIGGHPNLH